MDSSRPTYAFATYLATKSFLPGVLALHYSLFKYNPGNELIVLITDDIQESEMSMLQERGMKYKRVEPIINPCPPDNDDRNFGCMFTKLRIFELYEYDKVVYIDADMLVCADIEALFKAPHLSAVVAGALYPGNESWLDLNAGLLVIEPDPAHTRLIFEAIHRLHSSDGSDQGFLHSFYSSWRNEPERHLDHRYNVPAIYIDDYCRLYPYVFDYRRRKLKTNLGIIHYWGRFKPWEFDLKQFSRKTDVKWEQSFLLWWDIFAEALKTPASDQLNSAANTISF